MLHFPRAHWNQRTHPHIEFFTSISDSDRQYIKLIIFFLFALSKNTSAHTQRETHTNTQNNRSIYLFGMFSKQSHSIALAHSFIKFDWRQEREEGKKLRERKRALKKVSTSFVIDDEESNHVNLTFCLLYALIILLLFNFNFLGAYQMEKREEKKRNDKQVHCDKLFYELEQTEV